jgi:hypothetical protein
VCREFAGRRWSQIRRDRPADSDENKEQRAIAELYGLELIEGDDHYGLGRLFLHFGGNSGYQAINMAFLRGADRILLLGYDMHGIGHFFGKHPPVFDSHSEFSAFLGNFDRLARDLANEGVEVLNLTRDTRLECFKRSTVDALLSRQTSLSTSTM